jgi:hypothetical protein
MAAATALRIRSDSDLQGPGSATGWLRPPHAMRLTADMEATRHFLATAAIRILPLATLLFTILLGGCKGGGSGY